MAKIVSINGEVTASCNSCHEPFTPYPWKPGWTDVYCDRCQRDALKAMGKTAAANIEREIAKKKERLGAPVEVKGELYPREARADHSVLIFWLAVFSACILIFVPGYALWAAAVFFVIAALLAIGRIVH